MTSWPGWTIPQLRKQALALVKRNGPKMAARLCGVSQYTFMKFCNGKDVSLGTMVRIGEGLP